MKATRINAKQAQGLINNEEERFNDQPAIINNGDSKETSISYEGKTIKMIRIEMKLLKCFIRFYRIFFTKTNIRIKTIFAKKREMYLFYGVHCASMKINIIECLKALIFTNLQTICEKHLIFNDLKR